MPISIKELFTCAVCAVFISCGPSTNERGVASTTSDTTATGSAYKSYDGFAPVTTNQATVPVTAATPVSVPATDSVVVPATVNAPATAAPVAKVVTAAPAPDGSADIKRGEVLISKSDCLACHKVDTKLLGPSYKDVAAKYPNNAATISQLANKIKNGGSGVWGAIPMSPHPGLSDDDAKAMVRYILSLK